MRCESALEAFQLILQLYGSNDSLSSVHSVRAVETCV